VCGVDTVSAARRNQ